MGDSDDEGDDGRDDETERNVGKIGRVGAELLSPGEVGRNAYGGRVK